MHEIPRNTSDFRPKQDLSVLETTVGGVLRERAALTPEAPALIEAAAGGERGRCWTYGELLCDVERLACGLLSRFRPGERICIWAPNVPEWVIVEYAAALAGLTLVTANPAYQERELRFVLEQSGASALLFVREHRGNPMAAIAAAAAAGNPRLCALVDLEDHGALFLGGDSIQAFPEVSPTTRRRSSTRPGPPASPRGRLSATAASPITRASTAPFQACARATPF